jgi:hypothetical protein
MSSFAQRIAAAQTRWDAAAVLLKAWDARPPQMEARRGSDAFLDLVDEVRAHFDNNPTALELDDLDRGRILEWTEAGSRLQDVDAVGFGLNLAASAGFAQCWRERLGERRRLVPGDVYPVADAPWEPRLGSSSRTPAPRSMGIKDGDHPYARVCREEMLPVEFDFTLWRPLQQIARTLDAIAAVSVNDGPGELGLNEPAAVAFPVAAIEPELQQQRALEQLDRAIEADAKVIVFPELATSRAIADRIQERLGDDDGQRLVICGSWHEPDAQTGEPANVSVGLVSGLAARMRHRKIAEFGDLYPRDKMRRHREGIVRPEPPLLRIYVAGQFRFALVICKDMLDPEVASTLAHVGANVLLVPALSRTTQPFISRAMAHIADAQAVSVVANGPRAWGSDAIDPTAFLARPYHPGAVIPAVADEAPSTLIFSLRQGTARRA